MDSSPRYVMNRLTASLLALACLTAAGVILAWKGEEAFMAWAFVRAGMIMGAVALVAPPRGQTPGRFALSTPMVVLLVIFAVLFPRLRAFKQFGVPVAIAVLALGYFLRPRGKYRPRNRPS